MPASFGYSHTAAAPAGTGPVFVAGRFGAGPGGTVVSDDFGRQVKRAFHNRAVALAAHGLGLEDVVQLRTYVVNHDVGRLGPITEAVREGWGTRPPAQTLVGVAGPATPDVLFEVGAVAVRR